MRIADAATYERRGLKEQREHARSNAPWTIYKYRDENGNVVFEKVRIPLPPGGTRTKDFRYRHFAPVEPHGHAWDYHKPAIADRYLFNLPEVLRAKASGADIWWTEGEKDAWRLEEELEGADCSTCHHQAAGNATPEQAEWFRGHTGFVVLVMDLDEDDEYGRNPGAYCVIKRYDLLRAVGIAQGQIVVAAPATGKDIHDHLTAGLTLKDLVFVRDLAPLREKHDRGVGFGAWGYNHAGNPETLAYLAEWFASDRQWAPKVVRR